MVTKRLMSSRMAMAASRGRLGKILAVPAGLLPRTHDAPGGVDDGPVAVLVKGILYVLRSPPWAP